MKNNLTENPENKMMSIFKGEFILQHYQNRGATNS